MHSFVPGPAASSSSCLDIPATMEHNLELKVKISPYSLSRFWHGSLLEQEEMKLIQEIALKWAHGFHIFPRHCEICILYIGFIKIIWGTREVESIQGCQQPRLAPWVQSVPGIHVEERENQFPKLSSDLHRHRALPVWWTHGGSGRTACLCGGCCQGSDRPNDLGLATPPRQPG